MSEPTACGAFRSSHAATWRRSARTRRRRDRRHRFDCKVAWGVTVGEHSELFTHLAVRLVGRNTDQWLSELREAMQAVERLRADGPTT